MDNINISNLFPASYNKNTTNEPLNVRSLYNFNNKCSLKLNEDTRKPVNFSIDSLINVRKEKQKKIHDKYKRITDTCLNNIKSANKIYQTDIIFNVPLTVLGCNEYDSLECLDYIEYKLRKLHMDTYIISKTTIFISWLHIEDNMNKSKK
jgi:hypothetical protein